MGHPILTVQGCHNGTHDIFRAIPSSQEVADKHKVPLLLPAFPFPLVSVNRSALAGERGRGAVVEPAWHSTLALPVPH